ncbi:RES family NAD+ phosphorylase [Sphingomonas sp. TREG-RG-20F-R18-01]|uniref:RES family NAD+ phosphorylase n=1 Tax=Sphingomonas sp. TREG-RG-20F-R18-01 TaxID=2914982 RepID=UPI001F56BAC5|nr:RES family NAD+ phosphorylase [Sphingomonas sp. TREG-RG-20F-R18-01]
MALDPKILQSLTRSVAPADYLRVTPWARRSTPLGMGYGETRFASPIKVFKLLYIAEDLATSIAEAIIRDRFEGKTVRELAQSDIADWGVCAVSATRPLRLLSLRGDACFKLGISTDIVGAKAHDEARAFAQQLYDTTMLDGIVYHSRLRKKNCVAIFDRAVTSGLSARPVVQLERLAALVPALKSLKTTMI